MCRSIHTLRTEEGNAGREAVEAAARQYVRKVTGYRQPSRANHDAFEEAVAEVAAATERVLGRLVVRGPA